MHSCKFFSSIACALLASVAWCAARDGSGPQKKHTRILPPATDVNSPFAVDAPASQRATAIAFLQRDSMTAQDRQAVHDALPEIQRKAAARGFDLDRGAWSYEQIACPVFPAHILLLFSRDGGIGDVSRFSAIVPRDAGESVHVLPILRRSYALFTPAAVNPVTIAAFNVLRAHEHPGQKVDWLATGLCYAALTGNAVQLSSPANASGTKPFSPAMNSLLQVEEDGSAVVRFFDSEDPVQVEAWSLTFDKNGHLNNVAITPVSGSKPALLP